MNDPKDTTVFYKKLKRRRKNVQKQNMGDILHDKFDARVHYFKCILFMTEGIKCLNPQMKQFSESQILQ